MIIDPAGGQQVLFVEVPEDKQVKNRVHFDLVPTDRTRDEEIERVRALGGAPIDDRRQPTARGGLCSPIPRATSSASCEATRNARVPSRPPT